MTQTSQEIRLRRRPSGEEITLDLFEMRRVEMAAPADGEVQVRNTWMSVDPYMRNRFFDRPNYVPPFKVGAALEGGAVGEVTISNHPDLKPGDLVSSMLGWRERFNAPREAVQKLPGLDLPPEAHLGVAGLPGLTAYVGLTKIGELRKGETLFVSAASGAVGSVACQLAKSMGAFVVGSAGGSRKVAFLREIGCDAVIDYKAEPDLLAALRRVAPDGIDVYFDNVGGGHLEAAINSAKPFSRLILCGMISRFDTERYRGPANIYLAVAKRLKLQGYVVSDHFSMMREFAAMMADWVRSGQIKPQQTIDHGLEQAPAALQKLFSGDNFGKMLVRL